MRPSGTLASAVLRPVRDPEISVFVIKVDTVCCIPHRIGDWIGENVVAKAKPDDFHFLISSNLQ